MASHHAPPGLSTCWPWPRTRRIGAPTVGSERLAANAEGEATFRWGYDLLQNVIDDSMPRSLIHADLINRNVLVDSGAITGVFDWGCSVYGDHLYDLAWFEFWSSWYPDLDMGLLWTTLRRRWQTVGYVPSNMEARLAACYLHIGLDHLAYNAYLGNWPMLAETAAAHANLGPGVRARCHSEEGGWQRMMGTVGSTDSTDRTGNVYHVASANHVRDRRCSAPPRHFPWQGAV